MQECVLTIDGREVPPEENVALRRDAGQWVLYRNGKRVVKAWALELKVDEPADEYGGNANCAD